MAVAVAGSYSSNSTLSLGTSICCRCGPKKTKDSYNLLCSVQCWVMSKVLRGQSGGNSSSQRAGERERKGDWYLEYKCLL